MITDNVSENITDKVNRTGDTFTGDVAIGTTTEGRNLSVVATEGEEMAPPLEGEYWTCETDGTGGWTADAGTLVKTTSDGTLTATPSGTFTVTGGKVYKVTMTVSAVSGWVFYHVGWAFGRSLTETTFTDYIIARETEKITFIGGATATCTITSLSVKELTDATGGATINGAVTVRGQTLASYSSYYYPAYSFTGAPSTGLFWNPNDGFGAVYLKKQVIAFSHTFFGVFADYIRLGEVVTHVRLYDDDADILAIRNSTAQNTLRIYNTYTDSSNYERLSLTGVQGASVNITAESAGTGSANLDLVLTPKGDGAVKASNIQPIIDDTYYLGKNDDDSPLAWKGVILKDTTNGKYYRIEVISGVITATDLTD